jgi:hypothetical protein
MVDAMDLFSWGGPGPVVVRRAGQGPPASIPGQAAIFFAFSIASSIPPTM